MKDMSGGIQEGYHGYSMKDMSGGIQEGYHGYSMKDMSGGIPWLQYEGYVRRDTMVTV